MEKLLDLPFNEMPGSTIAHDYSKYHALCRIFGAEFVFGKVGNALEFDGNDYTKVKVPDLSGDFTCVFWLKPMEFGTYDKPEHLVFAFHFTDDSVVQAQIDTPIDKWQFVALVKEGSSKATVYVDGKYKVTLPFTAGIPDEFAIIQTGSGSTLSFPLTFPVTFGANDANYALGDIDELVIYNEAIHDTLPLMQSYNKRVFYQLDGKPFLDFDVYVSDSEGVIDMPEIKEPTSVDWAAAHGVLTDVERVRYKERTIKLSCFMPANGMLSFEMKLKAFLEQFVAPGLHRLRIEIDEHNPLVYEVYRQSEVAINKRWRDNDMIGTFDLVLIEPEPVKKVVVYQTSDNTPAYIHLKSEDTYNIFWGDGTSDRDVYVPLGATLTHQYKDDKRYEIVITGVPENLTSFTTNGIIIWEKL